MTDLPLGLDIGTTATKCVLVDPGRGVIAEDSRPVTLATVQAGWAGEDPAMWWRNACELIPAVLTTAGAGGGDVRGIGVAGMVPALICLDEAGRPLRPSTQQNDARPPRRWPRSGRRWRARAYCTAPGRRSPSSRSARRLPGCASLAALDAETARAGPGAGGLVLTPYFLGEKTPVNDPLARGALVGLHLEHGRGHLFRAVLEGTAFGFAHHAEVLRDLGARLDRVNLTGGGSRGRLSARAIVAVVATTTFCSGSR